MSSSVTINFHPDRLVADGSETLVERLAHDGVWRSQFETGTSNGGLTAHEGGDRWRWEQRMFEGRYDVLAPHERPRYGALNHRARATGAAVRFGSAHLRLHPHVLERTTFCYPDSAAEPEHFGASDPAPLVALADADVAAGACDLLDDYVEAQVHGPVTLAEDVAAIVLDPCYRDTPVADAAHGLGVAVEWHHGLRLHVDELALRPGYRGPEIVDVGRAVSVRHAPDGWLDARVIGEAVRAGRHHPQDLKKVWHHVARWGGPGAHRSG
ncbi:DUF3626 domain-containing protein [Promicromonospora thailandica]|uniref:DUF3626 domain-containing protein n=1 Tax=Promicromonospora thailandica TaxID=765201 RepID=A0A9X2JV46_9MICO|nr:DUF3626 domain-containing protein [Promicromonospora thailandica]MCP2264167.1 Protein of unknown function (DUF3626) [Promicromonospora thailandica]